jgi:hypothetical protein
VKPRTQSRAQGGLPRDTVRSRGVAVILALSMLPPTIIPSVFHHKKDQETHEPQFTYAGGTENVAEGCVGVMQLTSHSMAYKCGKQTLIIPYDAIDVMEYRQDVSPHVWKMNPDWKVKPPQYNIQNKKNHLFTLVYHDAGVAHIMVLDVPIDEMNPYLAEIELKTDRRVDVQRHDDYQ